MEIPNRALFKAGEVCEIAQVEPYVLRSWETEFPDLGIVRRGGGRIYRRGDVERVLRIKRLLFVEGLTLAGVRRRIEEDSAPVAENLPIDELLGRHARERLAAVKRGLQSLLELLAGNGAQHRDQTVRVRPPQPHLNAVAGSNGKRHGGLSSRRAKAHPATAKARKSSRRHRP